jgi:hypothetical protein
VSITIGNAITYSVGVMKCEIQLNTIVFPSRRPVRAGAPDD